MDRIWKISLMVTGIVLLDQLTKAAIQSNFAYGESKVIVEGLFSLTHVRNTGGAFGLLAGSGNSVRMLLFLLLPVVACFWLARLIWHHRHQHPLSGITYGLILAGAVGNLIDRFAYDYVVDFLDFYWQTAHFPAFNVADSAISTGATLLVVDTWRVHRQEHRAHQNKTTP